MPLLGKIRFKAQQSPDNLSPDDEVYVCKATGEVFKDYEKFFDQTILCNSLIWTCEVTGRGNLTFSEAVESEENSRKQIQSFPRTLHLPILHLVSLTKRTIFKDLLDDIYSFAKDRYFIGEQVTVSTDTEKKNAIVIKVFPVINLGGASGKNSFVTEHEVGTDGKKRIIIKSPKKAIIDSSLFQYMSQDVVTGTTVMSTTKNMSRNRNLFNRDTCRLFLKEHCEHRGKGIWRLKDVIIKKYNLSNVKFSDYFAGPLPNFPGSDDVVDLPNGEVKKIPEKKDAIPFKKELDRKQSEKDWLKQRDDLLCDDLLDLPLPSPLKMSGDDFGNSVMIMEFITGFKSLCDLELPNNFNIVSLIESLYEQNSSSLYLDLTQQLLAAIFQMQAGLSELNSSWKAACKYDQVIQNGMSLIKIYQSANSIKKLKSNKSVPFIETPLRHLPLDTSSLTELVRLHLLVGCDEASNQLDGSCEVKSEYVASEFSRNNPEIMKKLDNGNILDLKPGEKLNLLSCLIEQILCLPACRDLIEENYSKLKNAQKDLRTHVYAVQRREKDYINYNLKKKQEEEMMKSSKKKDKFVEHNGINSKKKSSILDLKDKDFEEMPMEGIDWDQLSQEEKDHIRNWSSRRLAELQLVIDNLQSECFLTPIGSDRTYRRYWLFRSVPGLFVEDSRVQNWTVPRSCLSSIKQDGDRIEMGLKASISKCKLDGINDQKVVNTIDKYFMSDIKKEIPNDKKPADVVNDECINNNTTMNTSTADINTNTTATPITYISVHEQLRNRGTVEWSVFTNAEQVDALVERLNKRGHREGLLRTYLLNNRNKIINNFNSALDNCSIASKSAGHNNVQTIFQFLMNNPESNPPNDLIKSESDDNKQQPNNSTDYNNDDSKYKLNKTKINSFEDFGGITGELELMKGVTDMILDLEERIFAGSLGQLKDVEREIWRKELECTDEKMNGGLPYSGNGNGNVVDDDIDVDDAQLRFNKKNLKKMLKMLVDVQQMLEDKYLVPPLGEDEDTRLKRLKSLELQLTNSNIATCGDNDLNNNNENEIVEMNVDSLDDYVSNKNISINSNTTSNNIPANNLNTTTSINFATDVSNKTGENNYVESTNNNDNNSNDYINNNDNNNLMNVNVNISTTNNNNNVTNGNTNLSKWINCVHRCNNFSQLYLCVGLLDASIAWSKSALNARCKICRKKKDADLMLLCDGCDQGHHMYCLKPPLKKIPEGDWYCPMCRPKELSIILVPRKINKNIKYKDYESDYDDEVGGGADEVNKNTDDGEEEEDDDATKKMSCLTNNRTVTGVYVNDDNSLDNSITRNGIYDPQYSDGQDIKTTTTSKNIKSQSKKAFNKTSNNHKNSTTTTPTTTTANSTTSTTTTKSSPSTGKLTRSGREIIKPRSNDEFIINQPMIKSRKRSRQSLDEQEPPKKSKRQCKASKYSDDFDYASGSYYTEDDANDDVDEVYDRDGDDENDDEYIRVKHRGRKKKSKDLDVSNGDKSYKKKCSSKLSTTSSSSSLKTSYHRQTSASMKMVEDVVSELMKNDNAWPFLKPVTIKEAPDYFDIIDRPMDLSTIKYKIYRFQYVDQHAIIDDLRLMFDNCNLYNSPNTPVHDAGVALEKFLDQRLEQIENGSSRTPNGSTSRSKRSSL